MNKILLLTTLLTPSKQSHQTTKPIDVKWQKQVRTALNQQLKKPNARTIDQLLEIIHKKDS